MAKKKYIHVAEVTNEGEIVYPVEQPVNEVVEKEEKMGFFAKNKGIILGTLGVAVAGAAGWFLGSKFGGSNEESSCPLLDYDDEELFDDEDDETEEGNNET